MMGGAIGVYPLRLIGAGYWRNGWQTPKEQGDEGGT